MNVQTPRIVAVGVLLAAAAAASVVPRAMAAPHLLAMRGELVAAVEAMPQARLRAYFLDCSDASERQLLPLPEAVICAIAWDTLLQREHGGDIDALLAWWRAHRHAAAAGR